MIARAILCIGAIAIGFASGWGNYLHVQSSGAAIIAAVVAAECFKFAMPWAFREHANSENWLGMIGTALVWLAALTFSVLNTFGNAVTKRADSVANVAHERAQTHRAIPQILSDIAALPPMDCTPRTRTQTRSVGKGKNRQDITETVTLKLPEICGTKDSLKLELQTAQAAMPPTTVKVHASDDNVRDGLVTLAAMRGYFLNPTHAPYYVVLVWVLFLELGSSLVSLAFPATKPKKATP